MRRLAIVLAAVLGATNVARADALEDAQKLENALEYEKALSLTEQTIRAGAVRDEHYLARLHFEAGKLAAGLDRADAARDHFARALAIDPSLALPEGASPKLVAPYEAARANSRPVHVEHRRYAARDVVGLDDALHVVASVRVEYVDPKTERAGELHIAAGPPFAFELAPGNAPLAIEVLDEFGNRVGREMLGYHIDRETAPHGSPWYASWKLWAASTAFAGGVAGLCAWRESVAQDDWNRLKSDPTLHDYSELRAVEDRGRAWALAANVGFGVAGAAAIIGTIAFVTHRGEPAVAVTVAPGHVGIVAHF